MSNFTIEYISLNTKRRIGKLVRDHKCLVASFLEDLKNDKNKKGNLSGIYAILEDVGNELLLPENRYKKLKGYDKLKHKPYEIRYKEFRLYTIFDSETGQLLIIGGDKKTQTKDLKRIEQIIKEYENFKTR
jgi:hypothetical protein